ncbi:hypothetical protein FHR75_004405 [Kineococcus radiotolerans]|uniref:Uncharacterized protein n=1 Tax=Kineococcus radiotolerans TaxID=131568 RepID=A0A7W4TRA5_KINRA|nr:hypothetical protein [Kineococcus radiotolerans]
MLRCLRRAQAERDGDLRPRHPRGARGEEQRRLDLVQFCAGRVQQVQTGSQQVRIGAVRVAGEPCRQAHQFGVGEGPAAVLPRSGWQFAAGGRLESRACPVQVGGGVVVRGGHMTSSTPQQNVVNCSLRGECRSGSRATAERHLVGRRLLPPTDEGGRSG